MCGIIAYKGKRDASNIALKGLKSLEYRGYDSWGIACLNREGEFFIVKRVGSIGAVSNVFNGKRIRFDTCIAHTRWATHGGVSVKNAHPHLSNSGRFLVAQNGIVENFVKLKSDLKRKRYKFKSDTDTEVIANLIDYEFLKFSKRKAHSDLRNFKESVRKSFKKLEGRNAVVVLDKFTGNIIAARFGSPLIVGVGEDEYFIASDIPAFLEYTNRVMYLDDGQMLVLSNSKDRGISILFYDINSGKKIYRRKVLVNLKPESAQKGRFKHFMIKEIMDQKETVRRAVNQDINDIKKIAQMIKKAYRTFSVACGTAGYASMVGEYLFSKIAKKHINFTFASEFLSHEPFLTNKTLMIVTSQSGETADVLEAMETAKKRGVKIVSLVNVPGSSIAKKSDFYININAGPEKAVASTKAFTSQVALHTLLAFASAGRIDKGIRLLIDTASQVNDMLNPRYEARIYRLALKLKNKKDIYVIGRGIMYPVSLEIALKIKEVSYVHADGLPGGELKHGTLALISKGTPCIVVVANDENKESILSNAMEVKARGGYIIGISFEPNDLFDYYIKVPDAGAAAPIVSIIPGQILAYHLAVIKKRNPDKPRNLAKSVTVK